MSLRRWAKAVTLALVLASLAAIEPARADHTALITDVGSCTPVDGCRWLQRYEGPTRDYVLPTDIAMSPDGSVLYVTANEEAPWLALLVAYDATTGDELWKVRWDDPEPIVSTRIAVDPSTGVIFLAGYRWRLGPPESLYVSAHSPVDGGLLWTVEDLAGGPSVAETIEFAASGPMLFVTGPAMGSDGGGLDGVTTVALDAASGNVVWTADTDGNGSPFAGIDTVFAPGRDTLFIATRGREAHLILSAVAASTGALLWERVLADLVIGSGERQQGFMPGGVGVFSSEGVVYVGGAAASGHIDRPRAWMVLAFGIADGSEMWRAQHRIAGTGSMFLAGVAFDEPHRRIFVAASKSTESSGIGDFRTSSMAAAGFDARDGSLLWEGGYERPFSQTGLLATALSPDGESLYLAGRNGANSDAVAVRLDAGTGARTWLGRYNAVPGYYTGIHHDFARRLVVGPDSRRIYVAGASDNPSLRWIDMVTISWEPGPIALPLP